MDYSDSYRRHRRRHDDIGSLGGREPYPDFDRRRRRSKRRRDHRRRAASSPETDSTKKRSRSGSSLSYESQDDKKGMIEFQKGDRIGGRYEIVRVAGQGTFGTVLECLDHKHGQQRVAVKAVRSVERYLDAACIEIEILQTLLRKDVHHSSLCVRLLGYFSARHRRREHMFLVFEYLGRDLYTFMKRNNHLGFSLEHVRSFAYQLLKAVQFCHSVKLCHTDLKPENILLCSNDYILCPKTKKRIPASTDIRLIDFGGATFEQDRHSRTIATRQYRAPEVIFGLPWSYPSDLWSLGCIFAELFTGNLLFNTHDDIEHLALMQQVLNTNLPKTMISRALDPFRIPSESDAHHVSYKAHSRRGHSRHSSDPVAIDLLSMSRERLRWPEGATSSASLKHVETYPVLEEIISDPLLSDLIRSMLRFEPSERCTAWDALKHPFFTSPEVSTS